MAAMGHNMVDIMGRIKTASETLRTVGYGEKGILGFCFNRIWSAIKREALGIEENTSRP